jgi:hypothetical protein
VALVKFQHWQLQQNTRNDPLQSLKILISENVRCVGLQNFLIYPRKKHTGCRIGLRDRILHVKIKSFNYWLP